MIIKKKKNLPLHTLNMKLNGFFWKAKNHQRLGLLFIQCLKQYYTIFHLNYISNHYLIKLYVSTYHDY
jgi:hypothetical protein